MKWISVPADSYCNTSKTYFPYILHESLLEVQEFKQMPRQFQVNQIVEVMLNLFSLVFS